VSKVVKGVGRAVSKVVKGVTNVVKKVASSKLGKVLLTAAAVYFGGAALMGGLNTIGTSTSFLSGMGSGLSSAATGIGNAWSALTSGKGLTAAAGELGSGFMGTSGSVAGPGLSVPTSFATPAANTASTLGTQAGNASVLGGSSMTPVNYSLTSGVTGGGLNSAGINIAPGLGSAGAGASKGLLAGIMSSQYTAPALISGGTQLIGGAMQGYGAQKQQERIDQREEDKLAAYNRNIGTRLWG
jgi:hypothetical protein